jgi:hypothetical protein
VKLTRHGALRPDRGVRLEDTVRSSTPIRANSAVISGVRRLVVECIGGGSLAERRAGEPLSVAQPSRVAIGIAEALEASM